MTVENTTKRNPATHLLGAMSEGADDYITGMEAAGQRQVVNSDLLPIDGPWEEAEALGIIAGSEVPDDIFRAATLPAGWARMGSGHSMWSYIADERGIKRIAIFYKAAFYDRSAHWGFTNPGYEMASELLHQEDEVKALPVDWNLLTEAEMREFDKAIDRMEADADKHPDIYGKYLGRCGALRALADER